MKKAVKLISIILLLVCTFCACQKNISSQDADSGPTDSMQAQPSESTLESSVSTPAEEEVKEPIIATPPEAINSAKTVTVIGELLQDEYTADIEKLQNVLNGYSHNISLAVCSVDGSKGLAFNTEAEIFGACTVKAAYTLYACKQMQNGIGSLQTELTYEQKHYEPGTGDMQYSPFGTVFTMETALYKSMSISDNVGYLMSVDYFGRDGYNAFINELGCPSLMIKPTVWSLRTKANDLVKIWYEIYNYFKTDTEYSRFLYNSCTNTAGNYATEALSGVEYSHKQGHNSTGDWLSLSDAGIVWKGDTPYIIAILTDAPGPSGYDAEVFAQIIDIVHNKLF